MNNIIILWNRWLNNKINKRNHINFIMKVRTHHLQDQIYIEVREHFNTKIILKKIIQIWININSNNNNNNNNNIDLDQGKYIINLWNIINYH